MSIEQELDALEDSLRRLKVEYDAYFGGGSKRPPVDLEWRVQSMLKKHDGGRLNYKQRFRFNSLQQRYAVYGDLWRQKLKIKEEGYRRPQDALLAITGLRTEEEHQAAAALRGQVRPFQFSTVCTDPAQEPEKVQALYDALVQARRRMLSAPPAGPVESFTAFLAIKTAQVKSQTGCRQVEFEVATENGQVRLKVRAK